jgi:serine/threonine-protein kinase
MNPAKETPRMTGSRLQIPGYEILAEIGKGAMGIVYKARQASVDRVVAIKVLRDAAAKDREYIARFRREATIAAKLSHNHIVNAIDAGEAHGRHYFVMEYVEGATVQDELKRGKVYDEKTALTITLAIARALKHAHERGLIHRDIKPDNIILTKDGGIKLADLGLARMTADADSVSEAGVAAGTPYYISPEQVRGASDVDIRTDIYSLGATLYQMVTGRPPYTGATPKDVMRQHLSRNAHLVPPDHLNTSLSSGLGEVVETMMAKVRKKRYRTPEDLILDLDCLLRGERPRLAEQKADTLALLSQGEVAEEEDTPFDTGVGPPPGVTAATSGSSTLVVILSVLLAISVLLNIVQLLAR